MFLSFAKRSLENRGVAIGRYVIMPDHMHFFVRVPEDMRLGSCVGSLKQTITNHLLSGGATLPVWQRGFFDHLLRSDESYTEKWEYVYQNPVRARLVREAGDWPWAGECVRIDRA
jgi:REP element-mobilizing transposase RayT